MALIKKNLKCRACSGELEEFLSLGKTALANSFLKKNDFGKEKSFPLRLAVCRSCKLVQLHWICSRKIFGAKVNTESVQSAKVVIRKQ